MQFLINKKIFLNQLHFSSIFGIKILDPDWDPDPLPYPDPDSLEIMDPDPDPQNCLPPQLGLHQVLNVLRRYLSTFKEARNRFRQPYVAWRAGTTTLFLPGS